MAVSPKVWFRKALESFWFTPALFAFFAVVLGEGLVALDRIIDPTFDVPVLGTMGASGGRSLLTTVGGSMITVAGTAFSITISVLATTTSTYGPRLVRNFMADRGNQFVLAVLTSTFVYCVVVLRSVRDGEDGSAFVPAIATAVAVLIGLADVGVVVYFIHHIATSVQVTTLQERARLDLSRAVESIYDGGDNEPAPRLPSAQAHAVVAASDGYIADIDTDALVDVARKHATTVYVTAGPGDHVITGETVASVARPIDDDDLRKAVVHAFSLGQARTPHSDLGFGVQQLTEMAVRALSPGTNDPYTPVSALNALAGPLRQIVANPRPRSVYRDDDGEVRLVMHWPTPAELFGQVFRALRRYGGDDAGVVLAAARFATRLGAAAQDPALRGALEREVTAFRTVVESSALPSTDRVDAIRAIDAALLVVRGGVRLPSGGPAL